MQAAREMVCYTTFDYSFRTFEVTEVVGLRWEKELIVRIGNRTPQIRPVDDRQVRFTIPAKETGTMPS